MNRTLFCREMKYSLKTLAVFVIILTLYTAMIIGMFDPKLGASLRMMQDSMPEIFALVGMNAQGTTLLSFLINYLFGFLYKVFPLIFLALLINRVLIRYIDRGTMAYLLATANSRKKIALTQIGVTVIQLFLMLAYLTGLTFAVCQAYFPGELDQGGYLLAMGGLFGLLLLLSGICYLSGCIFSDSGKSLGVGVGLTVLFILIQMVSQVGEKYEALRFATPLTLFDPSRLSSGEPEALLMALALYLASFLLYGVGAFIFCRRDLCV